MVTHLVLSVDMHSERMCFALTTCRDQPGTQTLSVCFIRVFNIFQKKLCNVHFIFSKVLLQDSYTCRVAYNQHSSTYICI